MYYKTESYAFYKLFFSFKMKSFLFRAETPRADRRSLFISNISRIFPLCYISVLFQRSYNELYLLTSSKRGSYT